MQLPSKSMLFRSYIRSTGGHRQSGGQSVPRCVHVAVVESLTSRTRPFPNTQRQLTHNLSAVPAAFSAREPAVNLHQRSTISLALVGQLTHHLSPTCITDGTRELAVTDQVLHAQVFDHDRLIFTDEAGRQLVQEVFATIGDLRLDAGYLSLPKPLCCRP